MPVCRILIVEDELLVATDIEMSLKRAGHEIIGIAEDYAEAVTLAEQNKPDLILMDIKLRGEKNGVAAATTIRERWQIPVIFLTANADAQTINHARAAGPYGFLTKPFRTEELIETVRIAIDQRQKVQRLFASLRWLTTVLDSLTDAVIATDANACVRYLNPAAEALTGWTPADAEGRSIEEVYPLRTHNGAPLKECFLRRALATGQVTGKNRLILTTRAGKQIFIEDSTVAIRDRDEIVGAVSIFLDIAERLAAERLQELERDRLEEETYLANQALGETRAELRALAANLMSTQEAERSRIARELHDDLGQRTALLGILLDRAVQESGIEHAMLEDLRVQISLISSGIREVSHRLHPSILGDLGLSAALSGLVEQERNAGVDITFTERNVPLSIALDKSTCLYRIAQEGIHNAEKHAPGAAIQLTLTYTQAELQLRIEDNGPGFSPVEARGRGGLGLVSMQERSRIAGGNLLLSTRPGRGTVLLVRISIGV